MIELTVALLAGLIVAMGIVGLSREATNTFHEEARSSAAEASLRAAIDRLRADLQRAGYMSTGNIQTDPYIARALGQVGVANANVAALQNLQGIHLIAGGKQALPLSTTNNLAPDAIEIAGNLTTSDQYDVAAMPQAPAGQGLVGCVTIFLSPNSPAMYRLLGGGDAGPTNAAQELANAFQPDPNKQFLVRLVDDGGRSQFLVTCGTPATGINPGNGWPFIQVDATATPIQTAQTTGTVSALNGLASGRAWVNPVQVARGEITTANAAVDPEPAQFAAATATDPNKYDLMRTILDATGQPTVVSEVIAEYAVDLKFAFDVDTEPAVPAGAQPTPTLTVYPFGDTRNATVAAAVLGTPTATPQRIRSVRVRLATRAAMPDRTDPIALVPGGDDTYMYRYCALPLNGGTCPTPGDGVERWARVRTLTTEVALPNQARDFY